MSAPRGKVISLRHAARLIYGHDAPSTAQERSVYLRMKSGALPPRDCHGAPQSWTTTEADVAAFMAEQRFAVASGGRLHEAQLEGLYRDLWRDYFLAVMLRRRAVHRSAHFGRLVVAGRCLLLVGLVAVACFGLRFRSALLDPQQQAVIRCLAEEAAGYSIVRWYPPRTLPTEDGAILEVEYTYFNDRHRKVRTRRTFEVHGDTAREVGDE